MRLFFKTKRRAVATIAALALVLSGGALAGFILFSGANGSGSGTFAGGTNSPAITINGTNSPEIDSTGTVALNVSVTNNDPDNAHTLSDLNGTTFSTTPSECAAYLAIGGADIMGAYTAGQTKTGTVTIGPLPGIPASCAGGSWTVNFQGTTNP